MALKEMKVKVKPLLYTLLMIAFLFNNAQQVFGQEKLNVTTGFGFPELLNIGIKYQINQTQIGLSVGSIPPKSGEKLISISSDIYYHFGGFSKLTSVKPWYARIGLNYVRDENEFEINKYINFYTRVGRDFNIYKKIGIQIDLGVILQFSHDEIEKKPPGGFGIDLDLEFPILPSFGIGLFYRI